MYDIFNKFSYFKTNLYTFKNNDKNEIKLLHDFAEGFKINYLKYFALFAILKKPVLTKVPKTIK